MSRNLVGVLALSLAVTPIALPQAPLADRLVAATPAQRSQLLEGAGSAVNPALLGLLQGRADAAFKTYDYAHAQPLYQAVLAVSERLADLKSSALARWSIGRCLARTGKGEEAIDSFRGALAISVPAKLDAVSAQVWRSISAAQQDLSNLPGALEAAEQSFKYYRAIDDQAGVGGAFFNMANTYFQMGQYGRAAGLYEECLRIGDAAQDTSLRDQSLNNLASLYSEQGDYAVALSYLERVVHAETFHSKEPRSVANTLGILAIVYRRLGRYAEALDAIEKALPLAQKAGDQRQEATLLNTRGMIRYNQGDNLRALADYQRCSEIAASQHQVWTQIYALSDVALTHLDLNQPEQALAEAQQALALARQIDSPSSIWEPLYTVGKAYRGLNRRAEAEASFREAIEAIESWRTQIAGGEQEGRSFFSGMLSAYHEFLAMRIEEGDAEGALRLAERAKAHQLLDVLSRGKVQIMQAMSAEERDRERVLSREAAKWNDALMAKPNPSAALVEDFRKAASGFEAFRSTLYLAHPDLKVRRGESEPIDLAEAGALLPDAHSLLLEFAWTAEAVYLFALERSAEGKLGLSVHKLPVSSKTLESRIAEFRRQLATRDLTYRALAASLYRDLLGPAQATLNNKSIVGIIPDGALWNLPFQALIAPGGKSVVERYALFYAPSLTALREGARLQQRKPAEHTLLAMASPEADLPHASAEVRGLGRLFGADSTVYIGDEATEQRWKDLAPRYRILHLATHGFLNSNNPLFSYLKLKPGAGGSEDGMLEAREIIDLDLHAELAVLSACETARGEFRSGEGVVGIGWAMMMAGTRSVVVSQWKVDSSSTSDFMLAFHRNLRRGFSGAAPLTQKAESLRKAALELIASPAYRHPYYWAGFQMLGDGY